MEIDEIKVGMYARTEHGKIWRVISTKAIDGHRRRIVNASFDVIDLIEVGDYVNGDRIDEIENGELRFHWDYEYSEYISYYETKDIKSIVTKEQFESMSYKVGE